jgi:hypothetical protein
MNVKWGDLGSGVYEEMVAVLISRLHPTAQRIHGTGGDGGRDVPVPGADGLHLFEPKSIYWPAEREAGKAPQSSATVPPTGSRATPKRLDARGPDRPQPN